MVMLTEGAQKSTSDNGAARLRMTERILHTLECIASKRFGCSLNDIRLDLIETSGDWCERTIYRDVSMLEVLGFVDKFQDPNTGRYRYVLNDRKSLSKLFSSINGGAQ
ncbi:hypothetical protein VN12_11715 [Pirellula sp. SH-Sr6A]|uniref:hypothetical protein n=1 Tax=Pirellula sp. SH-Sr6A TaxID=1632865 RepID=UPI00078BE801|nr:hypothetical protein [Pirellula sp. SH-Sr6A]AMV32784.1 hypothetical protein VN12_11715 [Pirellula sp. SH-Sr6A]